MENRKIKILAIDDMPDNLISIKALIRENFPDAEILTALDGQKGIELAQSVFPDVILLDIVMPGMDGFEVCRKLKSIKKICEIPVVFVTALKGDKESRITALECGAEAFLAKPIEVSELIAQIRAMVKINIANIERHSENERLIRLVAERTQQLEKELEERKIAESSLIESEKKYRLLIENLNEGIWYIDKEGFTTFVNRNMALMLGYTVEEMVRKHLFDFMDNTGVEIAKSNLGRRKNGIKENHEFEFLKKDGSRIYVSVETSPIFDDHGEYIGSVAGMQDITERRIANEILKRSEARHSKMLANIGDVIVIFDKNGINRYKSPNIENLFGWHPDELIGMSIWNIIHPDDLDMSEKYINNLFNEPDFANKIELRYLCKDGNYKWIEFTGVNLLDDPDINGILGNYHDISERKQADALLKESHDLLMNLANSVPGVIYQYKLNPDGTSAFPFSSPGMYDIYEVTPEMVKNDATPVFGRLHPEDTEYVSNLIIESARTLDTFYCEFRVILPKQGLRWRWSQAYPVRTSDGGTLWHGIISDITERKQSEKFLQDLIDKNPIAIQILDMNGYSLLANAAHNKLFGAEVPANYSIFEDKQLIRQGFGELFDRIKKGEVVTFPDSEYNTSDVDPSLPNRFVSIKAIGFTLKDSNGVPEKIVLMQENITERRIAEKMLQDIIEKNPMSIQIVDKDGYTIQGNPAYLELFGSYPPPDFSIFDDLIKKGSVIENLILRLKSGDIVNLPDIYYNPRDVSPEFPDRPVWIRAIIFPLIDSSGKPDKFVFIHENITERKIAEDKLRDSEERYRLLVNTATEGILVAQGRNLKFVNPMISELTGFNEEELLSKPFIDFVYQDDKELMINNYFKRINDQPLANRYPIRILTKSDSIKWVEMSGVKIQWDGMPATLNFVVDISERIKTEENLLKLNLAINNSREVVFMTDIEGIITYINPEFTKMYGFTQDEVIGKVTPRILKSGFTTKETIEEMWKLLLSKHRLFAEYINKTKDGRFINIEGSSEPIINEDGDIIGFIGIHRDISDRKIAEKVINQEKIFSDKLIESLPGIFYMFDSNFNPLRWNRNKQVLLGLTDEDMKTHSTIDYIADKDKQKVIDSFKQAFIEGESNVIVNVIRYDGKEIAYHLTGKRLDTENGPLLLGVGIDVNDRVKAENDLIVALKKAEESDQLKTAFLQNMSHEIRTPLNGIIGFTQLLNLEDISKEDSIEYTEIIKQSSHRLIEIVNNVLDLSKIETGQILIFNESFEINKLLNVLFNFFEYSANSKKLDLIYLNKLNSENIRIVSDESKINQILVNLISNAIKFTNSGYVEYGYEMKEEYVVFYVKDTGIGISSEFHNSIFNRFSQVDLSLTRGFEGAGLGLAICKGLVEKLGGKIWVESEVGKGSIFTFTIPKSINIEGKI
jgi:PAS domain S-box-containing protein